MGKTLTTLIKLEEKRVEDIQLHLADNRRAQDRTQDAIARWNIDAAAAFADGLADGDVRGMQAAGAFQHRAQTAMLALERDLTHLRDQAAALLEKLQAAYAAQKRFEILAEQQARAEAKAKAQKNQANLDEIGSRRPPKNTT